MFCGSVEAYEARRPNSALCFRYKKDFEGDDGAVISGGLFEAGCNTAEVFEL
jgi:hypothetical protein